MPLPSPVASPRFHRVGHLLAPVVLAGAVLTCGDPGGVQRRAGSVAVYPQVAPAAAGSFSGLVVDRVRVTVYRPPSTVVAQAEQDFHPESTQVRLSVRVDVFGSEETFDVLLELLAGNTVVFTGTQQVVVRAGAAPPEPEPVPVAYVGPGSQVAAVAIAPRDTTVTFGGRAQFRVTAQDSAQQNVASFYVSWSTAGAGGTVDAAGTLTAGTVRGGMWLKARTPTGVTDSTRVLIAPVPAVLRVLDGDGQTATAGQLLAAPLRVRVLAADSLPVSGVRVRFQGPGTAVVDTEYVVTDTLGVAGTTVRLGTAVGAQTFTASASGVPSVNFVQTALAGNATQLAFAVQPANVAATAALTPAVQVVARDALGNTATGYTDTVTIALASNPGGGTLSGTLRVAAVAGVATFADLSVDRAASGYTLAASAAGLTGATSAGFNVTVGPAATLALVSGGGQSAMPGAALAEPIVVKVSDAGGNGVSGHSVTFGVATGGGALGTTSATTDASGLASSTWTLGPAAGQQSVTVTAAGLAGSPLTVVATAVNPGSTTVTPRLDTLTALGETVTLAAQYRDSAGTPLPGSFTWMSRTPSVATVSAAGVVTALTNGATWVVVTEAGGTMDSARIVVEQRIASISVTPGSRSIYLTRDFTFTATAVDGLGSPMLGVTTFTWSSTAPAVASVDTAGKVTGVGLGSAQIRATSGAVTGVASVSIITPITRIAVVVDTAGAATTDTFTMTSLGLTRRYRAIAHDTLDAVMTGVTFTWVSTNGSVAVLDSITAETARATGAANGVTSIRATAQGFTSNPGALLTVSQVLASIELTPAAATIAPTGTVGLVARGKDANGRYIAGGSFTFASSAPGVATVGATSGIVIGVAVGTADITATSGAITSNASVITVSNAVPPVISFGRDTLSVGRGSGTSIPILLSRPDTVPLTVNLAVGDTVAYWSTGSVTIPAGATSVNATLNGRNAGTTFVVASDGSGNGYAPDTAVVKVTATMRLASTSYAINATDVANTQVLLSDPSPAGGTYVTFSYGTAGVAAVSPDPAFIPAGQLAADIQIRGLAGGTTTITPSAIGVNGTASSFTAYAPVLQRSHTGTIRLGQGQYEPNLYVYVQANTNTPIPVTLTSSDTNVVTVPALVTIPSNSNYVYFTASAGGIGSATISLSSPGWTASGTFNVTSTTPRLGISGGTTIYTTSPQRNVTVYAQDSTRSSHYRTSSLVVRLSSTDTTVMRVLDTVVTIGPGQYYTSAGRVIPGGVGGTAYIVATASGHGADSTLFTVLGPPLNLSWSLNRIGAGQEDYNLYVYTQDNVTAPLTVTLANPDTTVLGIPATVTIPAGTNYVYFTVRGLSPGTVVVTATAPGYQPDNATYVVTSPRVVVSSAGTPINRFAPSRTYTVYATDSLGNGHYRTAPLVVSLRSTDTTVIVTDTVATIAAGAYYTSSPRLTPAALGTAQIIAAAAGHGADTSVVYTVQQPKLNMSFTTYRIGRRQHGGASDVYVYTPDSRPVAVPVTLTQSNAAVDSLSATALTIDSAYNYEYFTFFGLSQGVDTIIATAADYLPDTAYVTVTTARFTSSNLPSSTTTTNPPLGLTVYAADSLGNGHYTMDTVVVAAVSSDTTVIRPAQPFFRIPKGAYYASTTVNVVGPGAANITLSDSAGTGYLPVTTNTVTVTGPSLAIANSTTMLGMRQTGGIYSAYVYTPNNVADTLVVNLLSTDTRVVTVPALVKIPPGSNYAYFPITAMDTVGTIQIQATALGYNAATTNVQVTQPKFVLSTSTSRYTTSQPYPITITATDANGNGHYTTEAVTATLASSAPSVAAIDSTTVTIPAGGYYVNTPRWSPGLVGTAQLSATDERAALYKYNTGTINVAVITPALSLSWGTRYLGIGQYDDYAYVSTPDAQAAPLTVTMAHAGTARTATYANLSTTPITGVTIPASGSYEYFRLAGTTAGTDTLVVTATSPAHIPDSAYTVVGQGRVDPLGGWPGSLAAGDSALVTLYARDQNQGTHSVLAATTFTLAPNANIEFRSGGAVVTQVTIPAGQPSVSFYVKALSAGTGSATITATNYQTYTPSFTVTP